MLHAKSLYSITCRIEINLVSTVQLQVCEVDMIMKWLIFRTSMIMMCFCGSKSLENYVASFQFLYSEQFKNFELVHMYHVLLSTVVHYTQLQRGYRHQHYGRDCCGDSMLGLVEWTNTSGGTLLVTDPS